MDIAYCIFFQKNTYFLGSFSSIDPTPNEVFAALSTLFPQCIFLRFTHHNHCMMSSQISITFSSKSPTANLHFQIPNHVSKRKKVKTTLDARNTDHLPRKQKMTCKFDTEKNFYLFTFWTQPPPSPQKNNNNNNNWCYHHLHESSCAAWDFWMELSLLLTSTYLTSTALFTEHQLLLYKSENDVQEMPASFISERKSFYIGAAN